MYRDLDAKLSESEKEYDSRPKIDRAELEEAEDKEKVSKIESLLAELDWDGIADIVK